MIVGDFAVWTIRGYQKLISAYLPPMCRFHPTCSNYAVEAIRVHGPARGGWLATRRVLSCHPFNPGGFDPVPPARASMPEPGREPPASPGSAASDPQNQVE